MLEIHRMTPRVGAIAVGVDVRTLDDEAFATLYRTWLECNVLVVRGQNLQLGEFLAYSRRFGLIEPHPSKSTRHPDCPEITLLGVNKFGAEYHHQWQKGDIVIWDNRCSYHKAAGDYPPEEDRIHWRVSIKERAAAH